MSKEKMKKRKTVREKINTSLEAKEFLNSRHLLERERKIKEFNKREKHINENFEKYVDKILDVLVKRIGFDTVITHSQAFNILQACQTILLYQRIGYDEEKLKDYFASSFECCLSMLAQLKNKEDQE